MLAASETAVPGSLPGDSAMPGQPAIETAEAPLQGTKPSIAELNAARCFALPSRCRCDDRAAGEKCREVDEIRHSNDEETGGDAVRRLKMLQSTAEQSRL